MNKSVKYGDQVYIEISNLLPFPHTDTRLLCSNGFADDAVFGVKTDNYRQANFRNSIFIITPNLVDSREETHMINSLKVELSFLSRSKPDTSGEKCLVQEITDKEKQIEQNKTNLLSLNQKIFDEMDGQNVCYGDVILLQHLESGYYLCAEPAYHPNNPSLHNVRLRKTRTPACYFKFFSYLVAHDRDVIDYGSEMKLVSATLNTVITMGEIKRTTDSIKFGSEDDELEDKEKPIFASDGLRRNNVLASFDSEPLAIGTALESLDNNRIRLAEYCSKENLSVFAKKHTIKNGDYVRFKLDGFYLTSSKSIHREDLGLYEQTSDGYSYNLINTIFQIVKQETSEEYPRGLEIQSTPKKANSTEEEVEKFYLKHFVTGNYLSLPKENLVDITQGKEPPVFQFVNSHFNHRYSLTRSSRVALKAFKKKESHHGEFFLEAGVEKHGIEQSDLNSKFYIGFKNSEDKIKSKLELVKKYIDGNQAVGSFFKIAAVSEEEMRTILEYEDHANSLKHFMRVLQCSMRKHQKMSFALFDSELSHILRSSEKLLAAIKEHDAQAQILTREFKIVDIIARFLYYFFVDPDITVLLEERKNERKEIVKLLQNFCDIILRSSQNNDLSHAYASQYIRVFIHSLLSSSSSLFTFCTKSESETLKNSIIILLYNFLWEKDLDTFGQLVFYEQPLFTKLDEQQDYSVHLLQLMTHYFTKKSPNLINTLLENFIQHYIGSEQRLAKIFPKIGTLEWDQEFEISFLRSGYPQKIKLSSAPPEVTHYLVWVFKLISAAARSSKSLKFWSIIMNLYSEELCENLLSSPSVPPMIKNGVLATVKSVHLAYRALPFDKISPKIQILLDSQETQTWTKKFENLVREAENSLIGELELSTIKQQPRGKKIKSHQITNQDTMMAGYSIEDLELTNFVEKEPSPPVKRLHNTEGISLNKLGPEILKEGLEDIEKKNLKSLTFTLQIMRTLLSEKEISLEIICLIHRALANLMEELARRVYQDKEDEEKDDYIIACMNNQHRIFSLLYDVEARTVKFAYEDTMKDFKKHHISQDACDHGEMSKIFTDIAEEWRSKRRLYGYAKGFGPSPDDKIMKSLWEIVGESDDVMLANKTIERIKIKTSFEQQIMDELKECVVISKPGPLKNLDHLASNLLTLNKILRRIQLESEFHLKEKEDEETLDQILNCLEEIFLVTYDYESHFHEEEHHAEEKLIFMERYRYAKLKMKPELPFIYKDHCISKFYQKIMKILNAHEILLPYMKIMMDKNAFEIMREEDVLNEKYKLGQSLIITIMTIFMHKNEDNQLLLSTEPKFITMFYREDVLESSIDVIFMFAEMCKENPKLLKLNKDYLFKVIAFDFVKFYNQFTEKFEEPIAINYIRSLPVIFDCSIPKDLFDPAQFMTETLFKFTQFLAHNNKISLLKLLSEKPDSDSEEIHINMPIFYIILKELLEAEKIFALTEEKERVLVLQSSFTLEKVEPLLQSPNIEFNFELKQLVLQTFENIYLQSAYQNFNIFLDYEHFTSFSALLFIDVYGYIRPFLENSDPVLSIFSTSFFSSNIHTEYLAKYDKFMELNASNVVFMEYQSHMHVKKLWKEYIIYLLCDFFGHVISHFKDFMLNVKEKGQKYENVFDIWLKLIIKVRGMVNDSESRSRLNQALKNAVALSEYAHKRELVHSLLENSPTLKVSLSKGERRRRKKIQEEDENKVLDRYLAEEMKGKDRYVEANLAHIATNLGLIKPVIKRLIALLSTTETSTKDIVFVLKLFRNFIEVENKGNLKNRQPIYQWEDVTEAEFRNIHEIQEMLTDLGLVEAVFHLFYYHQKNKTVFRELLLLCIALLYGGNKVVQDAFYEGFKHDYDNEILNNLAHILERLLESMRIKEGKRTQDAYFKALQSIFNNNLSLNPRVSMIEEISQEILSPNSNRNDYDLLLIILEFLQTLCEGHYLNFQEFLRDQTLVEHSKSFNIPEFLRQVYHIYYKYHNIHNVELGVKILDLLIEIQQGESQDNIDLMLKKTFINDLCNTLSQFNANLDLLARGYQLNPNHPSLMKLKSKVLIILKDIVEKSDPSNLDKIAHFMDLKALVSTFKDNLIAFHKKKGGDCPTKETLRTEDIWDTNLSNSLMVYCILKELSYEEDNEEFIPEIRQTMKDILENGQGIDSKIANEYLLHFFKKYIGSIEILQKKTNKLMRIYFPIPAVCPHLKEESKTIFANKVDRSNPQTKIADLMDSSVEMIAQMKIEYQSKRHFLGLNFHNLFSWLRFLTNLITIFVVTFDIAQLDYENGKVFYKNSGDTHIKNVLCSIQTCLAAMLAYLWLRISLSRYLAFRWDEFCSKNVKKFGNLSQEAINKLTKKDKLSPKERKKIGLDVMLLKGPFSKEWEAVNDVMHSKLSQYNLYFTVQSGPLLWHVLYFGICLASHFHPIIAAFQLFDIIIRSDTVTRIVMAISRNLRQFLWTLFLLFVTVYIYSLIGLYFMNERFVDKDAGELCRDAYSCLFASLNYGLRSGGGIADDIEKIPYDETKKWDYFWYTLFDLSNFIIICTLLLNLIFGMIIDAFGDLRDEKNSDEQDMKNVCFMCGLERSEYERTANFERHIAKEHNMEMYLAYLVYLLEKSKRYATDFTDIEDYVLDRYEKKDHAWIPIGRSLTLETYFKKGEKAKRSEIERLREDMDRNFDKVMDQTSYLISRVDEVSGSQGYENGPLMHSQSMGNSQVGRHRTVSHAKSMAKS